MALQVKKEYPPLVPKILEGAGPFAFIGDIHGCFDELVDLVYLVKTIHGEDTHIISMGDVCDRGPDVHSCFAFLREIGADMIIGNHDEKMLRWWKGNAVKIRDSQQVSIDNMKDEDFRFIEKACPFVRIPFHKVLAVHGGFFPNIPPENQDLKQIIRLREVHPSTYRMLSRPDSTVGRFWAEVWPGPEKVIFGHAWDKQIQVFPHAFGVDTGCVYGHRLTAAVLTHRSAPAIQFHQVNARKTYWADTRME
jgi:hypothetical protein